MSFLEQMSFDIGANAVLISLSVASSVQCCMVMSGIGEPVRITFISHRPGLRRGNSSARAPNAGASVSRLSATPNENICRVMICALSIAGGPDHRALVLGAQRPCDL